jgi:drug/metabolite transporter (DMT)-like permease
MIEKKSPSEVPVDSQLVGSILIVFSAISYSTAGLFTRIISVDLWTMLFFRGLFASTFLFLYLAYVYRGRAKEVLKQISWPTLAVTLASTFAMICNLGAYRNTSVANVVVIYAMAPFVAAFIAWVVLREPFKKHTLIASIISLAGVTIMMAGSLVSGSLFGDFLALGMTFFMSCMMVAIRFGAKMDMIPAAFFSSLLSMIITAPLANVQGVPTVDLGYLAIFGVTQLGLGLLLLTEGSRRIPSPQVALIGSLDIPFAVLWVWLAFSEVPATNTVWGGSVILLAVVWHMKKDRNLGR